MDNIAIKETWQVQASFSLNSSSSMISGFRNLQNMEAALDLHRRTKRGLLVIYRFNYTTLVSGLLKGLYNKGQLENAHKVLEDMDKERMKHNVYKKLLDCTMRCSTKGLVPDDPTYLLYSCKWRSQRWKSLFRSFKCSNPTL
ncbi:hypothetical protein NC653_039208 [Populus alba x Populus x berolinensis]|uniref:Pentatricopeptide repeat-containing protein n=1 Tax=Populus alba x Populus x berolinensis TaxID=444605 RepID=A0AAD6LAM8_9ROSI|nr:hypothetical protein NC653_039208 [Populus alba x Populus x berolinensis]